MEKDGEFRRLTTTVTSLRVLKLLAERDRMRVHQLAEVLEAPKSTVHGHLSTLRSEEFVIKEGDAYVLGPELLSLGNRLQTRKEAYVLAEEYVGKIYEETELRSIFVDEMGGRGVFIHMSAGNRAEWKHERAGNRLYLHSTAVGKAMLAEMPPEEVDDVIDRWGLPAETDRTITNRTALAEELEEVRERGYAYNRGENFENLRAVGVAATDEDGAMLGAFSVSGPRGIFENADSRQRIGRQLIELIEEFELELALT